MEETKLWASVADIPDRLADPGGGSESPWTASRPNFLVSRATDFPGQNSSLGMSVGACYSDPSSPYPPYRVIDPLMMTSEQHDQQMTSDLMTSQFLSQRDDVAGSQWSLRSAMGEMRSSSAGSWDNVDMRLPLSYYRALCTERMSGSDLDESLSEMEAVMRLLDEKERDLELAARIGQTLLADNRKLKAQVESLEEKHASSEEKSSQLQHDLTAKNELLRVYSRVYESQEDISSPTDHLSPVDTDAVGLTLNHHGFIGDASSSPRSKVVQGQSLNGVIDLTGPWPGKVPLATHVKNIENMHRKLQSMEEENLKLRSEMSHIKTETIDLEAREKELVTDAVKQLTDANAHIHTLDEELERKTDECMSHQEDVTNLLAQVSSQRKSLQKLSFENEELGLHLRSSQDAQQTLRSQTSELQDRYDTCCEMLHEARIDMKELEKRVKPKLHQVGAEPSEGSLTPKGTPSRTPRGASMPFTIDASQLLQGKPHPVPPWFGGPSSPRDRMSHSRRVLETVRAASQKLRTLEKHQKRVTNVSESSSEETGAETRKTQPMDIEPSDRPNRFESDRPNRFESDRADFDLPPSNRLGSSPVRADSNRLGSSPTSFNRNANFRIGASPNVSESSGGDEEGLASSGVRIVEDVVDGGNVEDGRANAPLKLMTVDPICHVDAMKTIIKSNPAARPWQLAPFDLDDIPKTTQLSLKGAVTSLSPLPVSHQSISSPTITRVTSSSPSPCDIEVNRPIDGLSTGHQSIGRQSIGRQSIGHQPVIDSKSTFPPSTFSPSSFPPSTLPPPLDLSSSPSSSSLFSCAPFTLTPHCIVALPTINTFTHNVTTTFSNQFSVRPHMSIPTPEELSKSIETKPIEIEATVIDAAEDVTEDVTANQTGTSESKSAGAGHRDGSSDSHTLGDGGSQATVQSRDQTTSHSRDLATSPRQAPSVSQDRAPAAVASGIASLPESRNLCQTLEWVEAARSWPQTEQSSPLGRRSLPDLVPDPDPSLTAQLKTPSNHDPLRHSSPSEPLRHSSPSDPSSHDPSLPQTYPSRGLPRPQTPADIAIDILPIAENAQRRIIQVNVTDASFPIQGQDIRGHGKLVTAPIPPLILGRPGLPGTSDLDMSLCRLSMRQALLQNRHQQYLAARRRRLSTMTTEDTNSNSTLTSDQCRDSLSSSVLSLDDDSRSRTPIKNLFPGRLEIVKPIEGSFTLKHWQQLARPHLGAFLEARPGVLPHALHTHPTRLANTRGGTYLKDGTYLGADLDEVFSGIDDDDLYSLTLSDFEVDDDDDDLQRFLIASQENNGPTDTMTNTRVLHLSDSTGSIPNLAQELSGEYDFLTPTKDATDDDVLKMFINKIQASASLSKTGQDVSVTGTATASVASVTAASVTVTVASVAGGAASVTAGATSTFSTNLTLAQRLGERGTLIQAHASLPLSLSTSSLASSGSLTPTLDPDCPSTPPSSPVPPSPPHHAPATPPNSPRGETRPSLYAFGFDLLASFPEHLINACHNSYPWYMGPHPRGQQSPLPGHASPVHSPKGRQAPPLKPLRTQPTVGQAHHQQRRSKRRARFEERLNQVGHRGTGGFLDFLENLGIGNAWYAGEEEETEAAVLDGHYVSVASASAAHGTTKWEKAPRSVSARGSARAQDDGEDVRHVTRDSPARGQRGHGGHRGQAGGGGGGHSSGALGGSGLNDILDVHRKPVTNAGVRLRANVVKT